MLDLIRSGVTFSLKKNTFSNEKIIRKNEHIKLRFFLFTKRRHIKEKKCTLTVPNQKVILK